MIADDHRFDGIGAYGNTVVSTPVLDRLAAEGVLFRSIYIMGGQNAAVCVPSRASLLTSANSFRATDSRTVSLSETENKDLWNLSPGLAAFPEVFRKAGYRTFGIGKWHNGKESFARSFSGGANIFFGGMGEHVGLLVRPYDPDGLFPDEAAFPSDKFSSELFADSAVDFIEGYGEGLGEDEPFLLYVAFTSPHDPRTPPPAYSQLYRAEDIPLPDNFVERHPFDNGELDVRDELLAPLPRTPDAIRRHLADYYGMISHMDAQIDRIWQALRESGRDRNTIVVYTADHGLALGQHGLMGKQNLYEHSIHIPLIVSGAGLPQGEQVGGLGCQIDIFPTLCDLAGVPAPGSIEGRSLAPLIFRDQEKVREYAFAVYKDIQRMVSDGHWKLIRYYRSGGAGSDRVQLFDLRNDPWETRDLHGEEGYQEHVERLQDALLQWQKEIQDPIFVKMNA
jgi:arylsulfatase A-like enzyme